MSISTGRVRGPEPRYSSSSSFETRFLARGTVEADTTRLFFASDEYPEPDALGSASADLRFFVIGASRSLSLSEDTEVSEDIDEDDLDDGGVDTFVRCCDAFVAVCFIESFEEVSGGFGGGAGRATRLTTVITVGVLCVIALPDFEENHWLGERVVVVDVAREGVESILRDSGQEAGGGSGEGEDKPGPQTSEGQEKSRRVRVLSQIGWLRHHAQGCGRDVTTIIRGVTAHFRIRIFRFSIRTLYLPSESRSSSLS